MDLMKNEMCIECPHLLDDQNYGAWKVHMSIFIKSLGIEVCQSVMTRWSVPTKKEKWRPE